MKNLPADSCSLQNGEKVLHCILMQHNSGSQRVEADLVCAGEKKKVITLPFYLILQVLSPNMSVWASIHLSSLGFIFSSGANELNFRPLLADPSFL